MALQPDRPLRDVLREAEDYEATQLPAPTFEITPARGREANAANSQTIIDQLTKSTKACETFAVDRIDVMIDRLQNLKSLIKVKSQTSVDTAVEFVRLIDDTLRDAATLAEKVERVEKNILP